MTDRESPHGQEAPRLKTNDVICNTGERHRWRRWRTSKRLCLVRGRVGPKRSLLRSLRREVWHLTSSKCHLPSQRIRAQTPSRSPEKEAPHPSTNGRLFPSLKAADLRLRLYRSAKTVTVSRENVSEQSLSACCRPASASLSSPTRGLSVPAKLRCFALSAFPSRHR